MGNTRRAWHEKSAPMPFPDGIPADSDTFLIGLCYNFTHENMDCSSFVPSIDFLHGNVPNLGHLRWRRGWWHGRYGRRHVHDHLSGAVEGHSGGCCGAERWAFGLLDARVTKRGYQIQPAEFTDLVQLRLA